MTPRERIERSGMKGEKGDVVRECIVGYIEAVWIVGVDVESHIGVQYTKAQNSAV